MEVAVQFPDILPPRRPVIHTWSTEGGHVSMTFVSASHDVEYYEVHAFDGDGDEHRATRVDTTAWADTTLADNVQYRFEIVAIDSAGNVSPPSKPVWAKPYAEPSLATPDAPKVSFDSGKLRVKVSWKLPGKGWQAIVFRRSAGGKFAQLSPLTDKDSFTDERLVSGQIEYALRFYPPEGGRTKMGTAASVDIP